MIEQNQISDKRISVLFISLYTEMGGGEYAVYNLLKETDRTKFRPIVMFNRRGEFVDKVESIGVETVIVPYRNVMLRTLIYPWKLFDLIKGSKNIYKFIKNHHPDVIQCSDVLSLMLIALPVLRFRIPVLFSLIFFYEWSRMIVFDILTIVLVKKIITNSFALRDDLKRRSIFLPKNIDVIYHAVDTSRFQPRKHGEQSLLREELALPSNIKLIGMIGRFDPWKGHIVFLRAMAEIIKQRPDVVGVIVGGQLFLDVFKPFQKYYDEVMRYHQELKLEGKVIFLSHRDDIPDVLHALDILVCPSQRENIPLTIFEAMASRIPVVASEVGGIPEQIEHGKNGFLFKKGDHIALHKAMVECLNADREALITAGWEKLNETFTMQRYVKSMEKVYTNLVKKKIG